MQPAFHVYIDEAGDPGVKPKLIDIPHWTDWFVISAVVISSDREAEAVDWIREMNAAIRRSTPASIHYRNLSDTNRRHVCNVLAEKPARIFVVASHKDTMRRHWNPKLGRANDKKFYNWCLRLLLERVTQWCASRSQKAGLETQPARIVFSERGGHDYDDLRTYLRRIEAQTLTKSLVLDRNSIAPGVIYESLCTVVPHANLAGLQLADIAASAFFQAVCTALPRHTVEPAQALISRLARQGRRRKPAGFGLMMLPFAHQGEIPQSDRAIFQLGGYEF
ncbi:DUF3800 domain-containing protein [Novosphingobium huizhouense]|uniref:DUF3800 domain-containing protein n=1 Tax=Novosphingobium huizhouense TaxID=2866625 RepID=UPI001CD89A96|nr:DUF3800 domain-containing protein [Novosphingobium huizhouense]